MKKVKVAIFLVFTHRFESKKQKKFWLKKCVELNTSPNPVKLKFKKVDSGNLILENDVIHDALKVICYQNFKNLRNSAVLSLSAILSLAGF
jgi:hypothetical protein